MSEKKTIIKDDYTIGELATKIAEHYKDKKNFILQRRFKRGSKDRFSKNEGKR